MPNSRMLDVEILYPGNRRQRVTDLDDGWKLPISGDLYQKTVMVNYGFLGSKSDARDGGATEVYMCLIKCPECWCTINKSGELWAVKIWLIEGIYLHFFELRRVNVGHEFF